MLWLQDESCYQEVLSSNLNSYYVDILHLSVIKFNCFLMQRTNKKRLWMFVASFLGRNYLPSRPLFLYLRLFNSVDSKHMFNINFAMTGFKPIASDIACDRSTN